MENLRRPERPCALAFKPMARRFALRTIRPLQVVSTIAEVIGRQAAPMAAEILEAIHAVKKPTSFALVMRDVRRNLLATGTPMVLGLTSEGDADWEVMGGGG